MTVPADTRPEPGPSAQATAPAVGRAWRLTGAVAVAVGLVVFFFWGNSARGYIDTRSLFWWWGYQWFNEASDAQHGPLVVLLAVWAFRRAAQREPGSPNPACPGLALGAWVGALVVHGLAYAVEQPKLSVPALLLYVWGCLVWIGGRRWARAGVFPVAFLLWAIPVNLLDTVGFWLRLGVVDASATIARGMGIAVVRSGTQLFAPDGSYTYDVAAACSGVRSLVALGALSLLIAWLGVRPLWVRTGVWLAALPLTLLGNLLRILLLIITAASLGRHAGDLVHEPAGVLVFLVVLGGELLLVRKLARWRPSWALVEPEPPAPWWVAPEGEREGDTAVGAEVDVARMRGGRGGARGRVGLAAACNDTRTVAISLVLAGCVAVGWCEWARHIPLAVGAGVHVSADGRDPAELPVIAGNDWAGRTSPVSALERSLMAPGTGYTRRLYTHLSDGRQVYYSVVLGSLDRSSLHRPEICLVGQGYTIHGGFEHTFHVSGAEGSHPENAQRDVPATVLRIDRRAPEPGAQGAIQGSPGTPQPELLAYFFVSPDHVVATHAGRLWQSAVDRFFRHKAARWAYIVLQADARDGEDATLARMQSLLEATLPDMLVMPGPEDAAR